MKKRRHFNNINLFCSRYDPSCASCASIDNKTYNPLEEIVVVLLPERQLLDIHSRNPYLLSNQTILRLAKKGAGRNLDWLYYLAFGDASRSVRPGARVLSLASRGSACPAAHALHSGPHSRVPCASPGPLPPPFSEVAFFRAAGSSPPGSVFLVPCGRIMSWLGDRRTFLAMRSVEIDSGPLGNGLLFFKSNGC